VPAGKKRPDSLYEAGRRSGAWIKAKLTQQQEFVIGGYTHFVTFDSTNVREKLQEW
jgi:hypothetical protein